MRKRNRIQKTKEYKNVFSRLILNEVDFDVLNSGFIYDAHWCNLPKSNCDYENILFHGITKGKTMTQIRKNTAIPFG